MGRGHLMTMRILANCYTSMGNEGLPDHEILRLSHCVGAVKENSKARTRGRRPGKADRRDKKSARLLSTTQARETRAMIVLKEREEMGVENDGRRGKRC